MFTLFELVIPLIKGLNGYKEAEFTGSRLYGDFRSSSNYDFIVLVENVNNEYLRESLSDWTKCSTEEYSEEARSDRWLIVRKFLIDWDINLIITDDEDAYNTWLTLDEIVLEVGMDKPSRKIMCCHMIRNGSIVKE